METPNVCEIYEDTSFTPYEVEEFDLRYRAMYYLADQYNRFESYGKTQKSESEVINHISNIVILLAKIGNSFKYDSAYIDKLRISDIEDIINNRISSTGKRIRIISISISDVVVYIL